MRNNKRAGYVLILLLAAAMMLISCGGIPASAKAGDNDKILDYRIADRSEGIELLQSNQAYYDGFTQNDLDFRMQTAHADMDTYRAFAREQVLDFTEEQKEIIDSCMSHVEGIITDRGYQIPELEQIVFINTTMKEECDATAYTHGTQIYINGDALVRILKEEGGEKRLDYIFSHELFHCMTRCSKEFRSDMYEIIHFTTREEDYELPPAVKEYFISNPDVEHHNAYATFVIDGQPVDCFAAFVTTRHFEKEGDSFFDCSTTALVPVDGSDCYYTPEETENFVEIFGTNTDYVIDPEECMADNFGYMLIYGMDGPEGKGYPNPEIISSIETVLR